MLGVYLLLLLFFVLVLFLTSVRRKRSSSTVRATMSSEQGASQPASANNKNEGVSATSLSSKPSEETNKPTTDAVAGVATKKEEESKEGATTLKKEEQGVSEDAGPVESSETKAPTTAKVETSDDPNKPSDSMSKMAAVEETAQQSPQKKSPVRRRSKSNPLSNAYGILSATQKEFLGSIDIHTAEQFLATRTVDIAPQFVDWRLAKGLSELKGNGPTASISAWKTKVRNTMKAMGWYVLCFFAHTQRFCLFVCLFDVATVPTC